MFRKVNNLSRGEYIEKYRDTAPEKLAAKLFDKCFELQELRRKHFRGVADHAERYALEKTNDRLANLFSSYGYKPTRYIVSYIQKECKDLDKDNCTAWGCDDCEYLDVENCVGTFGFYDFNISDGEIDAINTDFETVNLEATEVKEEQTGKVIWKREKKA